LPTPSATFQPQIVQVRALRRMNAKIPDAAPNGYLRPPALALANYR
jgi:hypothetical protein